MSPKDPVPEGQTARGWKVHHVQFGVALKEKMAVLGIESDLVYPGSKNKYQSNVDYFISMLKKGAKPQNEVAPRNQ